MAIWLSVIDVDRCAGCQSCMATSPNPPFNEASLHTALTAYRSML